MPASQERVFVSPDDVRGAFGGFPKAQGLFLKDPLTLYMKNIL